jgi:hypothetical protein
VASEPIEIENALRAEVEISHPSLAIQDDLDATLGHASSVYAGSPALRQAGPLTLAQAHTAATLFLDSPPSLAEVLPALSSSIAAAYSAPTEVLNQPLLLLFQTGEQISSPLPLSAESRVSLVGTFIYANWLEEYLSSLQPSGSRVSSSTCLDEVRRAKRNAMTQVIGRNTAALFLDFYQALTNCQRLSRGA